MEKYSLEVFKNKELRRILDVSHRKMHKPA
jgi:hypothetical protein